MYRVLKHISFCVMIVWSTVVGGQQSFFLDELFDIDVSELSNAQKGLQRAEIDRLRHDIGLTAGMNITNTYLEEIDAGLSTRIYAKANLWSGGYFNNLREAELIDIQMKIDSLKGYDHAVNHNYGLYYDYILYSFNKDKLKLAEEIQKSAQKLAVIMQSLYYNKLKSYDELNSVESIVAQYYTMTESLSAFNKHFEMLVDVDSFPIIDPSIEWSIEIDSLFELVQNDTTAADIYNLQDLQLLIQQEKERAPNLSVSLGYDISRHRPYYGININTPVRTHRRQSYEAKRTKRFQDYIAQQNQVQKEILNLHYEFLYKQRSINMLRFKDNGIIERQHQLEVLRVVLDLEEGIEAKKKNLESLLIDFEILDLRMQQSLILLQIKKRIPHIELSRFIKPSDLIFQSNKFKGNRYLLTDSKTRFSKLDSLFLIQNELQLITPSGLIQLDNVVLIYPEDFKSRVYMEEEIQSILKENPNTNFLFSDIKTLKALDISTIDQRQLKMISNSD